MNKKAEVKNFKEDTKQLNSILNKWDPLGVVPAGINDEYEDMIAPILSTLHKGVNEEELYSFISGYLLKYYEEESPRTQEFSHKIIAWWNDSQKSYSQLTK